MRSIRQFLLLRLLPAMLVLTLAGGLVLYHSVRGLLVARFDSDLSTRVRTLATLTTWTAEGVELEFADERMPDYSVGPDAEYFEIWLDDRGVLERSRSLQGGDLSVPVSPGDLEIEPRYWNAALPDGRAGRYVAFRFQPLWESDSGADQEQEPPAPAPQTWASAIVARSSEDIDGPLHALTLGLLAAGAVMALALSLAVVGIVNRGLRPLQHVGAAVEAIDDSSLSSRIDAASVPLELQAVCQKLNELLARLEAAFERERRFSSAAAHELRTPVAELRTIAEVAARWPGDPAAQKHAMSQVVDVAEHMGRMLETLLSLARSESGAILLQPEPITLRGMVESIMRNVHDRAARKRLDCRNDVPEALRVQADRAALGSIVANLIDNAVEYSPEGGRMRIAACGDGQGVEIAISNSNSGLEATDLPRVFEPFWRKDVAHSDQTHTGLGMTLVKRLAAVAGMRVNLALNASTNEVEARLTITRA